MNQQQSKFGRWIKTSITARMIMIGFLIIILLIPLSYIKSLITERMYRQKEVVSEIHQKWGKEVLVYGPILKVPYKTYTEKVYTNKKTKEVKTELIENLEYAYFFPKQLNINSNVNPEIKKRGIYKSAVYQSEIKISGAFSSPNFEELDVKGEDIVWEKAKLIVEISNLKGVNDLVAIEFNKNKYPLSSIYKGKQSSYKNSLHKLESKFISKTDMPITNEVIFNLNLSINGSEQIRFIPIGKETTAQIQSNWKTANFIGEYLPYNPDKIKDNGFDAKWKVLDINRPFPQESFNGIPYLNEYAFGVNFKIPVDEYQKSERSAKYGFLVIGLTFLVFFLIQTMSKISIHPFQYLMIGIALTMFYTLLIAISEHSNFTIAYGVAGIAVVLLISLYSISILKNKKFPAFIGAALSVLYAFIFVIIQLENYALIVGAVGLFVILAMVMYASRKIDWEGGN